MGCAGGKETPQQTEKNKEIEQQLRDERFKLDFKVLLLGAGESGKSTVVKQLKSIYKVKMERTEIDAVISSLNNNSLTCMQVLLQAADKFGVDIKGAEKGRISISEPVISKLTPEQASDIAKLWESPEIKNIYARKNEFWILDNANYYFENVGRFIEPDFNPTEEDIIMARVRTTGILLTEFDENLIHFRVVDVAGQKGERKKWIHCFDDVKAVVFVVNLAGYDSVMFEDPSKNQMHDAAELFSNISNNIAFKNTQFFILLNKKDLFEEMLRTTPLSKCFPEYSGPNETQACLEFIQQHFESKMNDKTRPLKTTFIAARFKKDIKYAWEELAKVLEEQNKALVERAKRAKNG